MEGLPEDILLVIIKNIATFEAEDLLQFEMTSTYHQKLDRDNVMLRALPQTCLWYLTYHWLNEGNRKLMQLISRSGHAVYSVASAALMLQGDRCNALVII